MAIMSRFVLPQQGRREQSQKQQDDYDQQNFATFVITVSHRTSYTRVNDDYGSPSVAKQRHFVRRAVATAIDFGTYQISAQLCWVKRTYISADTE